MATSHRIPKASDMVVTGLRNRILSEHLPVGHRLPSELELVDEFGLGRATVREGLRVLEREGLIEIKRGPTGGISVRHPDIGQVSDAISVLFALRGVTLREFLEFRQMVEPTAARSAARLATTEQRDAIIASAEKSTLLSNVADLHVLIGEASRNGVVTTVLQALHTPFVAHFRTPKIDESDRTGTLKSHQRIAQAIADGNEDEAERAMRVHLQAYADYLERAELIDEPIIPGFTWTSDR